MNRPEQPGHQGPPPLATPFDADRAKLDQAAWAAYLGAPVEVTNTLEMPLRLVPPGTFSMNPHYRVRLTRPYRVGAYEVTVGQFRAFVAQTGYKSSVEAPGAGGIIMDRKGNHLEANPDLNWRHPDVARGDDYPVAQVSWIDASKFCEWLGKKEGKLYRLPTDAEWDWACRAGSTSAYSFGDDSTKLGEYAWFEDNSDWHSHPVGQKRPNAWGLYDLHGNVCEYCLDDSVELSDLRAAALTTDPSRMSGTPQRQIRGMGFTDAADELRISECRASFDRAKSMFHFGFRVVCEVVE